MASFPIRLSVNKMLYKPSITKIDSKQHLHDIRYQRQKQIELIINECQQIRNKHKQLFDNQKNVYSNEKTFIRKNNQSIIQDEQLPIVEEFTNYLSESSSSIFLDNKISNNRLLTSKKKITSRPLSVSSVASIDKQANRVYEKWPDYTEISRIAGYRIEKPVSNEPSSCSPVIQINQKKRKKSATSKFNNAIKQVKNLSSIEKNVIKNQPTVELSVIKPLKQIEPKLPTMFCPTSKYYSKRIQTRQWLIKNDFTFYSLPLI